METNTSVVDRCISKLKEIAKSKDYSSSLEIVPNICCGDTDGLGQVNPLFRRVFVEAKNVNSLCVILAHEVGHIQIADPRVAEYPHYVTASKLGSQEILKLEFKASRWAIKFLYKNLKPNDITKKYIKKILKVGLNSYK